MSGVVAGTLPGVGPPVRGVVGPDIDGFGATPGVGAGFVTGTEVVDERTVDDVELDTEVDERELTDT